MYMCWVLSLSLTKRKLSRRAWHSLALYYLPQIIPELLQEELDQLTLFSRVILRGTSLPGDADQPVL